MNTVLIIGARSPVAVDLARSFQAAGYATHLADSVTPWAARCLRPRVPIHQLASPRYAFAQFRRDLYELVYRIDAAWIVPTCEEVFWVSEAAARDGYADRVFAPPLDLLRRLHSKFAFVELARAAGVQVPDTWLVTSAEELAIVPLAPREIVLKPEFSRFSTATRLRDLGNAPIPFDGRRWVVQRFIEGVEVCSWAAIHGGKVVAFAAYVPRWRHGRASIAFESIDLPAVRAVSDRIAAVTGMTGHLSLDLIVTPDGTAFPIECNPRAVSGVHLMDASPEMARAICGEGVIASPPAGRLRYLSPAMAVLGFPNSVLSGRTGELLRVWRQGSDGIGRAGNRLPAFGALLDAFCFATTGLVNGRSATEQTTADIEWNGEVME